jgi:hypothetical protein
MPELSQNRERFQARCGKEGCLYHAIPNLFNSVILSEAKDQPIYPTRLTLENVLALFVGADKADRRIWECTRGPCC